MAQFRLSCVLLMMMQAMRADSNAAMFLGSRGQHADGNRRENELSDLLLELEVAMGRNQREAAEQRVERFEGALRATFDALPKNSAGLLGSDGVRYLLHRLFVQRHGWFVKGLHPGGDAWNSSSPVHIFQEHTEGEIKNIFEGRLEKGFDLHHVAVLGATFESLVHEENVERLRRAYYVLGHSEHEDHLTEGNVREIVRAYMVMYVLGLDHVQLSPEIYLEESMNIIDSYPTWPDTEVFVSEISTSVLADVPVEERNTWVSTLKVLEQIGIRYGRWQDKECKILKKKLIEMDPQQVGRVSLDKFYAGGLHDENWLFLESVPYLEQLGALDQSDPDHLTVVIPNYLNSPTNCVASSKLYSVCCVDECDDILSVLETRIGSWQAKPGLIAQLVAGLSSDTVAAPRELPKLMVDRLGEISRHHGGQVPLHGRLFAQWMHHAYPRECPFPHMSGTTAPVVAEEFVERTGSIMLATKETMENIIFKSSLSPPQETIEVPWSDEEELFVYRPPMTMQQSRRANGLIFVGMAVVMLAILSVKRIFNPFFDTKSKASKDFFV